MNNILNKIYNCDNEILLKKIPDKSIQVFLEDPPYNTTNCDFEYELDFKKYWELRLSKLKDNGCFIIFGQEPFSSKLRVSNLKMYKYDLYWKKERPTNILQLKYRFGKVIETISIFYKKQCKYNVMFDKYTGKPVTNSSPEKCKLGKIIDNNNKTIFKYRDNLKRYPSQLLNFNRTHLNNVLHPTQKPIELIEYLIKGFSDEGDIIFDGYSGSGTTGIASYNLKRNFICCEIDKNYYEKSILRLKDIKNNLFDKDTF